MIPRVLPMDIRPRDRAATASTSVTDRQPLRGRRWKRRQAALPVSGVKQVLADYVTLTKPKVQLLLLLTTITTMYVAGDPVARPGRDHRRRRWVPERRRAARAPSTTSTTATSMRWAGRRVRLTARGADLCVRVRGVVRGPRRFLPFLLVNAGLHGLAQAPLAADIVDRRGRGRCCGWAAATRRRRPGGALPVRDRLYGRRRTSGRCRCS